MGGMKTKCAAGRKIFSLRTLSTMLTACVLFAPPRLASAQAAPEGPLPAAEPKAPPPSKPRTTLGGKPNLSGSWTLNHDQSDNARKKIEDAVDRRSSGGHSAPARPLWPGVFWPRIPLGYPYPHPRPSGGGGGGGGNATSPDFMAEFEQLAIAQTATSIRVAGQSGSMLAVYPAPVRTVPAQAATDGNGSDASAAFQHQGPTSDWEGNLLVFKQSWANGTTTRTYELSEDGKQLYMTTIIDNPRLKDIVRIRYVYDPTPSGG